MIGGDDRFDKSKLMARQAGQRSFSMAAFDARAQIGVRLGHASGAAR